jgi:hypothetical protein
MLKQTRIVHQQLVTESTKQTNMVNQFPDDESFNVEVTTTHIETNESEIALNETLVKPKNANLTELNETPVHPKGIKCAGMISVCKTMFIHTIGYKSDGIITHFLRRTANDLSCIEGQRGKANALKMKEVGQQNYKAVKEHIESYHPQVSHYNIDHAPNRHYLPCDIIIHQMYKDFVSKYQNLNYETYRKVFDKENIGFSSPTQDDCSVFYFQTAYTFRGT